MNRLRTAISLILGIVLVFFLALRATRADTHYVSLDGHAIPPYTNWYGAATNIYPQAYEQASAGDTIVVSNGVYRIFPWGSGLFVGKALTITSLYGAASTVLDGGGVATQPGIFVCADVTATVYGVTISNWNLRAVYMTEHAGAGLVLVNCAIINNFTPAGYNGAGLTLNSGRLWATNCIIRGNTCGHNFGGGVYFAGAECVLDGCTIEGNKSRWGGGIYAGVAGMTIRNSEIRGNSGSEGAGGVHFAVASSYIQNCRILGNLASNTVAGGGPGGVHLEATSIIEGCLVANNESRYNAGSVGGVLFNGNGGLMRNCTVVSNWGGYYAAGAGGVKASGASTSVNSIVYFNKSADVVANSNHAGVACTLVWSNNCTAPLPLAGSGNIAVDPKMVNMPDDCRLVRESPCINRGLNQAWMTNALDLDGRPRIREVVVDMGAYEWFPKGTVIMSQ